MTWIFNPKVSHMGGLWVENISKNAILTKFQLMIVFTEVNSIINNRPLSYISEGPNNPDPIANFFLSGRFDFSKTVKEDQEVNVLSLKRGKKVAVISKQFWKRRISGHLSIITKQINHTRTKYWSRDLILN